MNYCISIDWFQYFCHRTPETRLRIGTYFRGATKDKSGNFHTYYIGECQEFHSMYRNSYTIFIDNQAKEFVPWEPKEGRGGFEDAMRHKDSDNPNTRKCSMVHIYMNPKMSSVDPNSVSLKVANRLLYKADWSWYLHDIIEALHLTIKNITRIDMCLDFQKFAYQDLTPSEFIHRYVQDQSVATTETYVREGSNEYCIYGKKKMIPAEETEEITDDTEISVLSDFEYIRFGSRNSGVCTYLYNKSKELRDKKSKPWIRQRWEESGLNEEEGDIFRLEFSISAKGMCLRKADLKRGMRAPRAKAVRKLCRDDVETQRSLEQIFVGYLDKYFSFRLVGEQKYRKNMKRIELFTFELEPTMLPCYYNTAVNCGRAEKNAARTLQKLQWTVLDLSSDRAKILYQAQQILEALSGGLAMLKKEDVQRPWFIKSMLVEDKTLLDPIVDKAITEVEALRTTARQKIEELEAIMLHNDSDDKEWWLSDEDSLIAYS